jgi:hypothetical protein
MYYCGETKLIVCTSVLEEGKFTTVKLCVATVE